jgi:hypothetical protein
VLWCLFITTCARGRIKSNKILIFKIIPEYYLFCWSNQFFCELKLNQREVENEIEFTKGLSVTIFRLIVKLKRHSRKKRKRLVDDGLFGCHPTYSRKKDSL